jgi:hypothetical protein
MLSRIVEGPVAVRGPIEQGNWPAMIRLVVGGGMRAVERRR